MKHVSMLVVFVVFLSGPALASAQSSCCEAGGTIGCDDPACEAAVCAVEPFCCETAWDPLCASLATDLCEICQEPPPEESDCCFAGEEPGCSDDACSSAVCEFLPSCCTDAWSEACVEVATAVCGCFSFPPGPSWFGHCLFIETIELETREAGGDGAGDGDEEDPREDNDEEGGETKVTRIKWTAEKYSFEDCMADIDDGRGWFKFKRASDAATAAITRSDFIDGMNSFLEFCPLPEGMHEIRYPMKRGVRGVFGTAVVNIDEDGEVAGGDFVALEVEPAGKDDCFETVDIVFAHTTICSCEEEVNTQEITPRLQFGVPGGPDELRENSDVMTTERDDDGDPVDIYYWTDVTLCNRTETNTPVYDFLPPAE